jgi:hypothetical protein
MPYRMRAAPFSRTYQSATSCARRLARGAKPQTRTQEESRKKGESQFANGACPCLHVCRYGTYITAHICTGTELTPCPHPGRARTFPSGPSEVCEEKRRRPDGVSAAALFGVARWPFRGEGDTPVSASRAYDESSYNGEVESAERMLSEGV